MASGKAGQTVLEVQEIMQENMDNAKDNKDTLEVF